MFYGCSSLSSLDLSNFIPNNALDMEDMFYGCSNLYSLDLSNTLSVLNMSTVNQSTKMLICNYKYFSIKIVVSGTITFFIATIKYAYVFS